MKDYEALELQAKAMRLVEGTDYYVGDHFKALENLNQGETK
jgi:hypothetical protein